MSIISRLLNLGESKANAAIDTMEDPTQMSEQILRDLKIQLQKGIESEADIKAIALGHRADEKSNNDLAEGWKSKCYMLVDKKDKTPDGPDKDNLNHLAEVAAQNVKDYQAKAQQSAQNAQREESSLAVMDKKLKDLRDMISKTENDVEMIRSQQKTAEASEKINKAMSSIDTDGLVDTMKRMHEKVTATELRAQAYAEVDNQTLSTDQEIDKVLQDAEPSSALDEIMNQRKKSVV